MLKKAYIQSAIARLVEKKHIKLAKGELDKANEIDRHITVLEWVLYADMEFEQVFGFLGFEQLQEVK